MNSDRFEQLVTSAVEGLPEEFLDRLENIIVVIENYPTPTQLDDTGGGGRHTLLGLYEGVPLTRRGLGYNLVTPDRIIIFQKPIESICRDDAEITLEIQRVVQHEIAHHFGIGDGILGQIEKGKRGKPKS